MSTGSINISSNISRSEMILQNYPPKPCSNFIAKPGETSIVLRWTDPDDNYTTTDNKNVIWKYTRIVRKIGGYPLNENDGTIVVNSSIKNQYQFNGYVDNNLSKNVVYYYRAFTCSTDGIFNREQIQTSASPASYKIMTVILNLNNSNPANIGSYTDDATTMSSGKNATEWDNFFEYRPCLFKSGKVVGYLNPNDYTKFVDGSPADITSGNTGDVMIEFPRRGVRISKSGNVITVSMTDNPNDSSFKYYAHQRGSINKDYFYLGAYLGTENVSKLRSLSNKTYVFSSNYMDGLYSAAVSNGSNYGIWGYYQFVFIQVMYILQFKGNFDIKNTLGKSLYPNSSNVSGKLNTSGLMYGNSTIYGEPVKLFGLEDAYGNYLQYVDNIRMDLGKYEEEGMIYTTTDDTIRDISKYTYLSTKYGLYTNSYKYYETCVASSELGIVPYGYSGSSSTYFCAATYRRSDSRPLVLSIGGSYESENSGIFDVYAKDLPTDHGWTTSRLQYL